MIRSMTGFARREARGEWGLLAWELRSINHRYLEVQLRLPEEFRALENDYRETVKAELGRGKVDAVLRFDAAAAPGGTVHIDAALAGAVAAAAHEAASGLRNPGSVNPMDILRWPGVVKRVDPDLAPLQAAAGKLLDDALGALRENRTAEGARIRDMLLERGAEVSRLVAGVHERIPEVRTRIREKMLARIEELGAKPDPDRLEQELVFIAQRLDVAEELDRLESHVTELSAALDRDEPVGRRLDFLMQEFNREANTLGSKSQDTETTQASVELKVLIEQMREQIQNVE